jgi:hypothetical protein
VGAFGVGSAAFVGVSTGAERGTSSVASSVGSPWPRREMTRLNGLSDSRDSEELASSYRRRTSGTKYAAHTATTNATISPLAPTDQP